MKKTIFILGLAGVLFAGYLSSIKLFAKTCAFGEPCQLFLGYPACYFGFVMFLLIAVCSYRLNWGKVEEKTAFKRISFVSFLGILFAGYFTLRELPRLLEKGFGAYFFGLPTCSLGLIFFALIFALALKSFLANNGPGNGERDIEE